ncbi:hypothetical protein [Kitasatospora purpeofusca]|uniref:HMG-box domain-containing protein n=1 Tax=Kitasatospora purpeofusca TaxID=67352 RepID=A0ABZ1UBV9_9ACTN|nr:hypothetical protein [Kitasatospora purpeofusca]
MTSETKKKDRTKRKKDPNAPKRALTAYMFYGQEHRERVKQDNPAASVFEIAKILGSEWEALSDAGRVRYLEMAARDKARAEQEMAIYEGNKRDEDD